MAQAPQVRAGRVSKVDFKRGTYEVVFADRGSVSCRINAQSNGEYKMPEIGQVVSVSLNGNGTVAGATLGTIWNETNQPEEGYQGLYRKEYGRAAGDSYERYDANTGEYTQYCRSKTGRVCNGNIYDECKGGYTAVSGGNMTLRSTGGSVSITAASGAGITANKAVSIDAGTYVSLTAQAQMALESGSDMTVTVGGKRKMNVKGKNTETFTGETKRTYAGKLTEEMNGDVAVNV